MYLDNYYKSEFEYIKRCSNNAQNSKPNRLLFFINVLSGNGIATDVFLQATRPYLVLAGIKYDIVVVTSPTAGTRDSHVALKETLGCEHIHVLSTKISNYIQSMDDADYEKYDGFVVVGGDGTLGELATGCVLFSQKHNDEAFNKGNILPNMELETVSKPIGIIPAGSTNAVACTLNGTLNPHVAGVCIALGYLTYMDVQAVFLDGCFKKVSLATVSCGFLTNVLVKSRELSHFGVVLKLAMSFAWMIVQHARKKFAVQYRTRDKFTSKYDMMPCQFKCPACNDWLIANHSSFKNQSLNSKSQWREGFKDMAAKSAFYSHSNPTRLPVTLKKGIAPLCHMSDGTSQLSAVSHDRGRIGLLLSLLSMLGSVENVYNCKTSWSHLAIIQSCCEFRVTAEKTPVADVEKGLVPSITWNIDGETLDAKCMHAVVHSKLLKFFGTGGQMPPPGLFDVQYYRRLLLPFLLLQFSLNLPEDHWHRIPSKRYLILSILCSPLAWLCILLLALTIFMSYSF